MKRAHVWRILLIEDDEDDYILMRDLLDEIFGNQLELHWLRRDQAIAELNCVTDIKLIILNYAPRMSPSGLDIAVQMKAQCPGIAIIMVTSYNPDHIGEKRWEHGVDLFLQKESLSASSLRAAIFSRFDDEVQA